MKYTLIRLTALLLASLAALHTAPPTQWDLGAMVQPVPMQARFSDPDHFIWCGAPTKGADGEPNPHEAKWMSFHAASPVGQLKQHHAVGD